VWLWREFFDARSMACLPWPPALATAVERAIFEAAPPPASRAAHPVRSVAVSSSSPSAASAAAAAASPVTKIGTSLPSPAAAADPLLGFHFSSPHGSAISHTRNRSSGNAMSLSGMAPIVAAATPLSVIIAAPSASPAHSSSAPAASAPLAPAADSSPHWISAHVFDAACAYAHTLLRAHAARAFVTDQWRLATLEAHQLSSSAPHAASNAPSATAAAIVQTATVPATLDGAGAAAASDSGTGSLAIAASESFDQDSEDLNDMMRQLSRGKSVE
jgi:hypothetical protein